MLSVLNISVCLKQCNIYLLSSMICVTA